MKPESFPCDSGFVVSTSNQERQTYMKDTPFNPVLPAALTLLTPEPPPAQPEVKSPRRKASPRKSPGTTKTRRALDPKRSAIRFARKISRKTKASWKRIKCGISARLANLDREQLKKVLLACGIAAAAVAAILLLVKLTPLIIALLAVLGLGVVLQMWERLRVTRVPA